MKWEKKEEAEAKARMLKLLEQDKVARFGKGVGARVVTILGCWSGERVSNG